ncbi:MAG: bifunctional hydroxymethylpyrimidine kinase/phosphomethylpyrimidine kinase [Bacillota bacterium]
MPRRQAGMVIGMKDNIPKVLSVGGSDPSGGAGIQADLKVMARMRVYGAAAVTVLTRQTSHGVISVFPLPLEWVMAQAEDVLWDLRPGVVKTGMMASAGNIRGLARLWRSYTGLYDREDINGGAGLEKGCPGKERTSGQPENIRFPALVVDPVFKSGTGVDLLASGGVEAYFRELFPLAAVVTPNVPEAEALTGLKIRKTGDMERAAAAILDSGTQWVLLKGGHLPASAESGLKEDEVVDLLCSREKSLWLKSGRVPGAAVHGTGCTLASALASLLALGVPVAEAARRSTRWVRRGIAHPLQAGRGRGVVCQQGIPLLDP